MFDIMKMYDGFDAIVLGPVDGQEGVPVYLRINGEEHPVGRVTRMNQLHTVMLLAAFRLCPDGPMGAQALEVLQREADRLNQKRPDAGEQPPDDPVKNS